MSDGGNRIGGHEDDFAELRGPLRDLLSGFAPVYHRDHDAAGTYPEELLEALTSAGWLATMIPEKFGGAGLGLAEASVVMEEINRSGANAGHVHGQMYNMATVLHHGSEEQKARLLPEIAAGRLRMQSMAVTEPTTGTDTTALKTRAEKRGNGWVVQGQKVWTSRVQHSDILVLLARTTPREEVERRSDGLSVFLVDLREALGSGIEARPIANMVGHETNELFIDRLELPGDALVGEEGRGFRYILSGLNAERILIAAECIGDGYWFIEKASAYAREREVFGRLIGQNQGIAFPLARAYANLEAANAMRWRACDLFDRGLPCGAEANMAKLLAADASFEAANACMQTFGGFGFAREYDVERKFRETRLYQVAPISTNLILSHLAQHELGLPRSF